MLLTLETLGLCLLFFLICYLGTGTDLKNVRSFSSYPDAVQKLILSRPELASHVKKSSPAAAFVSNVVLFSVILFLLGLPVKVQGFFGNFLNILILGEVLNAFDFLVIDSLWFRSSRRTRFSGTEEDAGLYRDLKNHRAAFFRGIAAFLAVAVIDGLVLSLF